MPKFGALIATDIWEATARTLTDISAEEIFDLPLMSVVLGSISCTSAAGADTYGSWSELVADVGAGKRLIQVVATIQSGTAYRVTIEFGAGTSGSEAAIGRIRLPGPITVNAPVTLSLWLALDDNIRLSARVRDNSDSGLVYFLGIHYA